MDTSRNYRYKKIIEIIEKNDITTQQTLVELLQKDGLKVRQSTLSRDMKKLGVIKGINSRGEYCYIVNKVMPSSLNDNFQILFTQAVIDVDCAINFVVIKCLNGMASAVCATLDSLSKKDIVGTIAGDDTIFVLLRNEVDAQNFKEELTKML